MKKAISCAVALAGLACVSTVVAESIQKQSPAGVDARVLVPKPATGPVARPKAGSAAPAPLSAAAKSSLAAAIQAAKPAAIISLPARATFTIKITDLGANSGFGWFTGDVSAEAESVYFNRDSGGGMVAHFGALDGAWLVDCAVSDLQNPGAPFAVVTRSFKNGALVAESTANIGANNGHVVFGAYFSGGPKNGSLASATQGNIWTVTRVDPWRWHSCTVSPV